MARNEQREMKIDGLKHLKRRDYKGLMTVQDRQGKINFYLNSSFSVSTFTGDKVSLEEDFGQPCSI